MKRIRLIVTFMLTLTMLFGSTISVFAKDTSKKTEPNKETATSSEKKDEDITSDWNWYKPGETKTISICESMEDEAKDWEYVKGTESFYDADFVVTNYFVDPEGKDKTTYEIFATLDNSKHNTKKYNTWVTADGVIDLNKMADVREDENCKVDYVKEKDKDGTNVYYHIVITAPNDMELAFYFNGGFEEEHKEVKLIGNLYNGLSNGIQKDTCVVMKLNPDDENYPAKAGKKDDGDGFTIRNYRYGDVEKIQLLSQKYDAKGKLTEEKFFDASFEVTSAKKTDNKDGSSDFEIVGILNQKNCPKGSEFSLVKGVLKTDKLAMVNSDDKEIKYDVTSNGSPDGIVFTFKVNVPESQKDNVAIYIVSSIPKDYKLSENIGDLPNALSRGFLEDDIFFLKLTSDFKDYQKK